MNNLINLVILFKTTYDTPISKEIYDIVKTYIDIQKKTYDNIDSYFIICDNTIDQSILLDDDKIFIKCIENNYESILIKVVIGLNYLRQKDKYTHYFVCNITSIVNIPILLKELDDTPCKAHIAHTHFKQVNYIFPSGAGYLLNKETVITICDFFEKNNYIQDNGLIPEFKLNYPETDDIFLGYFFNKNNIKISILNRLDYIGHNNKSSFNFNKLTTHYRIKGGDIVYMCNKIINMIYS
jgi:hypothetical protein